MNAAIKEGLCRICSNFVSLVMAISGDNDFSRLSALGGNPGKLLSSWSCFALAINIGIIEAKTPKANNDEQ